MKPGSCLAVFALTVLGLAHLLRLISGAPVSVDGSSIPMGASLAACVVLGLVAAAIVVLNSKKQGRKALVFFLAGPLLTFVAIGQALRLIFRVKIVVAGVSIPVEASIFTCVLLCFAVLLLWKENRNEKLARSLQQLDPSTLLLDKLTIPWVDRSIAVIAVLPFAFIVVVVVRRGELNIPLAVVAINHLIIIATMIFRTPPARITSNPWYWVLAFVATYGGLYAPALVRNGVPVVPDMVSDALSALSLAVLVFARLSLGRSMGFVPAQRVIVTRGAYSFVRHPIYSGIFLSFLAWTLRVYSLRGVVVAVIWCSLFVVKSIIEESFLREDPVYADYLARVRWRWFPGLV